MGVNCCDMFIKGGRESEFVRLAESRTFIYKFAEFESESEQLWRHNLTNWTAVELARRFESAAGCQAEQFLHLELNNFYTASAVLLLLQPHSVSVFLSFALSFVISSSSSRRHNTIRPLIDISSDSFLIRQKFSSKNCSPNWTFHDEIVRISNLNWTGPSFMPEWKP